jgi:N-acetylmuramoyl-L-alanine amidase
MFKLAISAGHYLDTPGKRCHKDLDPNETREWVLNNRVADKLEKILADYEGIEILRVDDTTGKKNVTLAERTGAANKWGADFYLSIHHNAANKVFNGGGIVAYACTLASPKSYEWQSALYAAAIKHTGLKGNRSNPLARSNLYEVRETKMPAVLMECGFMDSTADVPIILSEEFADDLAKAFAEVIVERSGATKKARTMYRVQCGCFSQEEYAKALLKRLDAAGFDGYITTM